MLKHIETHKTNCSKTEDVYNEQGDLLFTIQYRASINDAENKFEIDYVRSHCKLDSNDPLEAYKKLLEEERNQKRAATPSLSLKQIRKTDPQWIECQKAARLLLKQGLRAQVKTLLREYNKAHTIV